MCLANEEILVSSSNDQTVCLWDFRTGLPIRVLIGHSDSVYGLKTISFNLIASASNDKTIRIWDTSSGRQLKKLIGHTSYMFWSLDMLNESVLISGSDDTTIKLWNVSTGALMAGPFHFLQLPIIFEKRKCFIRKNMSSIIK